MRPGQKGCAAGRESTPDLFIRRYLALSENAIVICSSWAGPLEVLPIGLSGVYKNMKKGIVALVFRCRVVSGHSGPTEEAAEVRLMASHSCPVNTPPWKQINRRPSTETRAADASDYKRSNHARNVVPWDKALLRNSASVH